VFDLTETTIWGRDLDKAQAVVDALALVGISALATTDLERTLAGTDLVAATTTATQPFIVSEWVKPGTHLGLIGAFTTAMAEAEPALLPKASLFADTRDGVLEKGGEVWQAVQSGLIKASDVRAELAELVALDAPASGRRSEQEITVFKSVGFAALDLIAAEHLMRGSN